MRGRERSKKRKDLLALYGKPTFTLLGYYIEKGKGSKIFLIELETKTIRARIK